MIVTNYIRHLCRIGALIRACVVDYTRHLCMCVTNCIRPPYRIGDLIRACVMHYTKQLRTCVTMIHMCVTNSRFMCVS